MLEISATRLNMSCTRTVARIRVLLQFGKFACLARYLILEVPDLVDPFY